MKYKVWVFILLLSILIFPSFALPWKVVPLKTKILPNETASYLVEFNQSGNYSINVNVVNFKWFVWTDPSQYNFNTFEVRHNLSFKLYIKSLVPVQSMVYVFPFQVITKNKTYTTPISLFVKPKVAKPTHYPLNLYITSTIDKYSLLPGSSFHLDVLLENKNPLNVGNVDVSVHSKLFNKDFSVDIKPRTNNATIRDYKKYFLMTFTVPSKLLPMNDTISVSVKRNGTLLWHKSFPIAVGTVENHSEVERINKTYIFSSVGWFLLSKNVTLTLNNFGNVPAHFFKRYALNWYDKFVKSSMSEGNGFLVVNETLKPYSSKSFYYFTSYAAYYIILLVIILIILAVVIAYYVFRSPFVFNKKYVKHNFKNGKLIITLNLEVINRSRKEIKDVTVKDRLPNLAEPIMGEFGLNPEVLRTRRGTILKWKLDSIGAKDDVLLTYKFSIGIRVFGDLKLEPAKLIFSRGKKKVQQISNELFIKV